MIVKQIYTQCLAQASYYIESDGESVVIDPIRDIDSYVSLLDINNSKLKFILETHFHADFISGHLELNKKYGVPIIFGHNAEPAYNFLGKKDGEIIEVGKVKIKIIHTPGHTLESVCYLLIDENGNDYALFTGDTLFIGDVGIPDVAQRYKNTTKEDLDRKNSYKKIAEYKKLESNTANIEKFLKSLNPKLFIDTINKKNLTRSSQLIAKTNQFKFNSNVFSEERLVKLKKNTLVISFKDKIQNYGIIGVVVYNIDKKKKILEIQNFVLSCRVFSRRIENFIISFLIKKAKISNCTKLYFKFDLTKKNFYLQEFLKEIGFVINSNKSEYLKDFSSIINNKKQYIKLTT